jgi:hypothetical protein
MAAIWRDIEIEWDGESYKVRPSMDFINYLERKKGSSLSQLFIRAGSQDLPSGKACELIADTLKWAGCKNVTTDDVFAATAGFGDAVALAMNILTACMPNPPESAGAKTAKKKPVASRARQKPTGDTSTE